MSFRASLQKQFTQFHENIKLHNIDDNKILRDKREMLVKEIRDYLEKKFKDSPDGVPTFQEFNQGSYSMKTGIKPLEDEDYDIDIGLMFFFGKGKYKPVEVKKWIHEALDCKPNRNVQWKYPCIRVQYEEKEVPKFHVDFTCYSSSEFNSEGKDYLAKGKPTSSSDLKIWEESDPKALKKLIEEKVKAPEDRKQFKRIIKCFKRWKDKQFKQNDGRPTGISVTACALEWLTISKYYDYDSKVDAYEDIEALKLLVQKMLDNFAYCYYNDEYVERLKIRLPVEPYNELFAKMSNSQMKVFKEKLSHLKNTLQEAQAESNLKKACEKLNSVFGEDFWIPEDISAEKVNNDFTNGNVSIVSKTSGMALGAVNRGGFYGERKDI